MGAPHHSFYRSPGVDAGVYDGVSGREGAPRFANIPPGPSMEAPTTVSSHGARSQPTTLRGRLVAGVVRHRAFLLSLLLAAVLSARGAQLALTGKGFGVVGEGRADLAHRMQVLEESKKAAAALRKDVADAQGVVARKEGLVERLREELREQEASVSAEELALKEKSKELAERRERMMVPDALEKLVSRQLRKRPKMAEAGADPLKRAEAELAVFDLATSALPREKEKTLLMRELSEVVKMRAAATVLRSLPAEPTTSEEARDLLRARRMLMSSAVRVQSIAWAAIMRLLEVKGELQVEQTLMQEPDTRFLRLFGQEWTVEKDAQDRLRATLEDLDQKLKWCLAEQHALQSQAMDLGLQASSEQLKELELSLYSLESYEISVRARKAQITYAEGSGPLSREAFIEQRSCRVERARDNAAERKRRLPSEAEVKMEVQLSLSALGRVLKELQDIFQEARELSEEFGGIDPRSKAGGNTV
ncbi:hypothetical protein Emed_002812 [Eimeria media]